MSSTAPPTTMKAWQYSSTVGGLPKNLSINPSAPVPKPKPSQNLIKVHAVTLNPVDYKPAENQLLHRLAISKPATPGIDFVGEIVTPAVGSEFEPGQLVFGAAFSLLAGGMLAEYGVVAKETCALLEDMKPVDGASIGIAGLTAYQCIIPNVKPGGRVFINGGSGGVGLFQIQIAKVAGLDVTVTCSGRNVELCRSLGAEAIDYTKGDLIGALKASATKQKYDIVIDNVFTTPELYWKAHEYTVPEARYLVVAGSPSLAFLSGFLKMKFIPSFLGGGKRKFEFFGAQAKLEDMCAIKTLIVEKKVRVIIDSTFPFEQAPQAFEKLQTGRSVGKVVIEVLGSSK